MTRINIFIAKKNKHTHTEREREKCELNEREFSLNRIGSDIKRAPQNIW